LRFCSPAAEEEEEAATSLVTREILKRKVKEAAVKKALEIAAQISVPSDVLLQKTTGEATQAAIELSEDLQQLVRSEVATSEAAASRGNSDLSHSVIEVESRSETSTSTSSQDSSDLDDVTLSLLYKNISPSTKQKQRVNAKPFEPVYSAVLKSTREMSQMRIDICNKLPANHPLQPHEVEPLNVAPADAKCFNESAGSVSSITATSSQSDQPTLVKPLNFDQTQTKTQTQTLAETETNTCEPSNSQPKSPTKLSEPNVFDQLVSHYSGELPEVESELQNVGTKGVSQNHLLSFDDNKVSKIINWIC